MGTLISAIYAVRLASTLQFSNHLDKRRHRTPAPSMVAPGRPPAGLLARALACLLLVQQLPGTAAAPTPAMYSSDAEALLALKASFSNGDEVLTTWQPGSDACVWAGVACDASKTVVRLELAELGLVGTTPQPDGWPLPPSLQEFYFTKMPNVTGPIPPGWRLPKTLTVLYSPGLPYGGSLSAEWILPDSLKFLNLGNCNLSGPLPEGWPLPANLTGITLSRNSLTGTIPSSFTALPNLQALDLEYNQLTGSIPAAMSFGDYQLTGLVVAHNNLSGTVPYWPDHPLTQLVIQPGNPNVCGQVPAAPVVVRYGRDNQQIDRIRELPPCPGEEASSSGGTNTGAIVGGVVGGVAALALVLAGTAWLVARKKRLKRPAGAFTYSEKGANLSSGGTNNGCLPPQPPFNPFAGGPKRHPPSPTSRSSVYDGSSHTLPISAAASLLAANAGSGHSSGMPEDNQRLAAKLQALQRDPPSWFIDPDRIVLEQGPDDKLVLLGRGSYGHVYRGWLKAVGNGATLRTSTSGHKSGVASGDAAAAAEGGPQGLHRLDCRAPPVPIALKVMDTGDVNAFLKEAAVMQRLADSVVQCPQVVALHGACVVGQQLVVAMELIEGGDLRAALSGDCAHELSWRRRGRRVALDIAAGLAHLHASGVMHRDLKSKNVLLTRDWRAKVADVGTAALHSATYLSVGSSRFGGTLAWAAPELLLAAPCTNKIDIYSLGVVLWELATQEVPQRGFVQLPPASEDCPQGLCELICECLLQDPAARPTAQQVLERLQAL